MAAPLEPQRAGSPRLLKQVRDAVRRRNYSHRTEETYVHLIRRFIYFSGKRHPAGLGAPEVTAFLNHLVRERDVAAATQNQALSALLFFTRRSSASSRGLSGRTAAAPAERAHAGRGPAAAGRHARDEMAHGQFAVRGRAQADGVPEESTSEDLWPGTGNRESLAEALLSRTHYVPTIEILESTGRRPG